jgi:hypothetical protein
VSNKEDLHAWGHAVATHLHGEDAQLAFEHFVQAAEKLADEVEDLQSTLNGPVHDVRDLRREVRSLTAIQKADSCVDPRWEHAQEDGQSRMASHGEANQSGG